jgi:phosphonate transport system substrate-binding protein
MYVGCILRCWLAHPLRIPRGAARALGLITFGLTALSYSLASIAAQSIEAEKPIAAEKSGQVVQGKTFTIGVLSYDARKHISFTSPLAKYLAKQLEPHGYTEGYVKVTNSIVELGHWLDIGKIDMVSETLFSSLKLQQEHNADIRFHRWKKGQANYQTVFFARKASGIHTLDDLVGKTLVLEDRSSTSGFYIPIHTLLRQKLAVTPKPNPNRIAHPDNINIVVAGDVLRRADETSISTWVAHGQADAGAFSNTNWEDPGDMPPHLKSEMELIYRTEFIPRSLILLRRDLPTQVKQTIEKSLINAHQSEEGKAALHKFQKTSRFETFSPSKLQSFSDYNDQRLQIERLWFR